MNYLVDEYILNSRVYKDIIVESQWHEESMFLSVDHEGIIRVTEELENVFLSLQALEIDKGIPFCDADVDGSEIAQGMFVKLAAMCGGSFAHDTLCQYLSDARLVYCQLAIARDYPSFYDKVNDKSNIRDEVNSYFKIVA